MNSELISISMNDLSTVSGGQQGQPAQQQQQQQPQQPQRDYPEPHGNPVMQGGQMIDNAAQGWRAARQNGCSWYEALGNATIAGLGLSGGFGPDGKPRGN
ncbi:MAG TPA: hypothetical protein VGG74_29465 [Kofleriaceae bacterium]